LAAQSSSSSRSVGRWSRSALELPPDSSRCKAWQTQDVEAGENKNLLLSTNEEGCNWGGNVVYFGMRFSKEAEDSSTPFNYVGLWRGFDRDCFTVQ